MGSFVMFLWRGSKNKYCWTDFKISVYVCIPGNFFQKTKGHGPPHLRPSPQVGPSLHRSYIQKKDQFCRRNQLQKCLYRRRLAAGYQSTPGPFRQIFLMGCLNLLKMQIFLLGFLDKWKFVQTNREANKEPICQYGMLQVQDLNLGCMDVAKRPPHPRSTQLSTRRCRVQLVNSIN